MGKDHWHSACINKMLHNPFYCGRNEYRKQYVPDYLTQKKINNHGEIEKIYVEGIHEKLISPEDFDKVQEMRKSHTKTVDRNGRPIG